MRFPTCLHHVDWAPGWPLVTAPASLLYSLYVNMRTYLRVCMYIYKLCKCTCEGVCVCDRVIVNICVRARIPDTLVCVELRNDCDSKHLNHISPITNFRNRKSRRHSSLNFFPTISH